MYYKIVYTKSRLHHRNTDIFLSNKDLKIMYTFMLTLFLTLMVLINHILKHKLKIDFS